MTKKPKALITGITGQDGSYLAEYLLKKGYEVHGIIRRVALENPTHRLWRIQGILKKIHIHSGTIDSYANIFTILNKVKPGEFYHLGSQSYVDYSFQEQFSWETGYGTLFNAPPLLLKSANKKGGCH